MPTETRRPAPTAPRNGSAPSTSTLAGRSKRGGGTAAQPAPTVDRRADANPAAAAAAEPTQPYTPPLTHISDGQQAGGAWLLVAGVRMRRVRLQPTRVPRASWARR